MKAFVLSNIWEEIDIISPTLKLTFLPGNISLGNF